MTKKRLQKLIRAHFTAYYMQHQEELSNWVSNAYKAARNTNANNNEQAYKAIVKALPLK